MISHSKPKRRKTKRDDFSVWFGDIGSTYVRKKIYHKKKKKKVSPTNIKPGLSGPARGGGGGGGGGGGDGADPLPHFFKNNINLILKYLC